MPNHIEQEESGCSGQGRAIRRNRVARLLRDALLEVHQHYARRENTQRRRCPFVSTVHDTNETFWNARGQLLERYRTEKDDDGNYKYFPYKAKTYVYPSIVQWTILSNNEWHSIGAVWKEMEKQYPTCTQRHKQTYSRVALLRNDTLCGPPSQ